MYTGLMEDAEDIAYVRTQAEKPGEAACPAAAAEARACGGEVPGRRTPRDVRLKLHVLASGSKGNCSIVQNVATGACVVVDCGISLRAFSNACAACGVDTSRIEAILITHEHSDHTKGLGVVTRGLAKAGTSPALYVSRAVHGASRDILAIEDAVDLRYFKRGDDLSLGGMAVHAFPTLHDAAESFGFRFDCGADSVGFVTDTGIVTDEARAALLGCRVLAIEANYDSAMLESGPYPRYLKDRVASDRGHLSNAQSAELLAQLLDVRTECVVGMHVSQNNNTYRLPPNAFEQILARHDHPAQALVAYQERPVSA